jgi:hypothetical protein
MSVAILQRSISGDCNAHKRARSGGFRIVITVFDQTTVVIPACYVYRFVTEILIAAEAIFYGQKDFAQRRADASRELRLVRA